MGVARGNIKTTLVLDGEAAYTAAMSKLKRQQQALRAEGRALASTYDEQTTSQQKLIDKTKNLEKQIEAQKQIVNKNCQELEAQIQATGSTSTETYKLNAQYNNSVAALNKLKKEYDAVTKELNDMQNGAESLETLKSKQQALLSEANKLKSGYNQLTSAEKKLSDESILVAKQIENQKLIVKKYHEELNATIQTAGKNSEATYKMQSEYNDAAATLNNLEKQLNAVTKELKEQQSSFMNAGKMGTQYGDMMKTAGDKIEGAGRKFSVVSGATAALGYTALDAAMDYESAFTGVKKTIDATDEQFATLYNSIIDLSTEIPATAEDIASVAEIAGQLGIGTESLLDFTQVMIALGESTNLSAEEAASALAKFANITGMSEKDYERLGSVIVGLGNNFATTEADIVNMAMRLASTGEITGLSESQMMAIATSLSSVGIEAEAGGSSFSKLLKKIQLAVETGSGDLSKFASVSNMSVSEFKELWGRDAVEAIGAFTQGLNDTERNGKSAVAVLDDLDIKEVRMSNTILALSKSEEKLTDIAQQANTAWSENTALTEEVEKRYATLESKFQVVKNTLHEVAITFGEDMMPYAEAASEKIKELAKWFNSLDESQRKNIIRFAAMTTAAGPLLMILGKTTGTVGSLAAGTGKFLQVIGKFKLDDTTKGITRLAKAIMEVNGATGDTTVQAAGMVKALGTGRSLVYGSKETQETMNAIGEGIDDFRNKIELADGSVDAIKNSLDFSEKDSELQQQYDNIQKKINDIATAASDERRALTDNEKEELHTLFEELELITEQQAALFKETQDKIITLIEAENSLTDDQAANYIKKAQTAKTEAVTAAEETAAAKISILEETMSKEDAAYKENTDRIYAERDVEIQAANDKLNSTIDLITQKQIVFDGGYETFKQGFFDYNKEMSEIEQAAQEQHLSNTENNWILTDFIEGKAYIERYKKNKEFCENFLETNQEATGAYLETVQQTIDSGAELSGEQVAMCLEIIAAYEKLPESSKKAFGDTIESIRTEIQSYDISVESQKIGSDYVEGIKIGIENTLYKISDAGKKIAQKLMAGTKSKEGLDENSPSKKGKKIGKDYDEGIAIGVSNNTDLVEKEAVALADTLMSASTPKNPKIALQPSIEALQRSYQSAVANTAAMQQAYYSNTYINNNNSNSVMNNYNSGSDSYRVENAINSFKNELCFMLKSEFKRADGTLTERQAGRIIKKCLKSVGM